MGPNVLGLSAKSDAEPDGLSLEGPKFAPGVTVEAWPLRGADFALATVVGCDARGLYTVFYEDDTVEDGVDELRIRYQGQVQSDVLAPGESVRGAKQLIRFVASLLLPTPPPSVF